MMVSMYITSHREGCQQTSSVFLASHKEEMVLGLYW